MASAVKYPNDRTNPAGAIPVFLVPAPTPGPPWPNQRTNGAIPVNFVPVGTSPNSGPIPVNVVAGLGTPPFGNDQGNPNNAIPVYEDANGMPVWAATGTPPAAIAENITSPSISPTGIQNSGTLLTADPGTWTNDPDSFIFRWNRNGVNIGTNTNTYMSTISDRNSNIGVNIIAVNSGGESLQVQSSNTVQILGVPVNVIAPSLTPVGPVDVGTGLAVNPGVWTNTPTGYYYTWRRNEVTISGATMNVYLTVDADADTIVDCVMLAINAAGSGNALSTSNQVYVNPLPEEP
jgi:hypothetical protein